MSRREHTNKISLNCSLKVPASSAESSLHTPNTPEILNTIVNIAENLGHPPIAPLHPLQIKVRLIRINIPPYIAYNNVLLIIKKESCMHLSK